jgi:hypothetical protein
MNASPEMVTEICERMKEFWNKTQRPLGEPSFKLPYVEYLDAAKREALEKAISNFVRSIEYDVHELMAEIMSERLRLEIELYRLRLKK